MKFKDFMAKHTSPNREANYYWHDHQIPNEVYGDLIEPDFAQF